jgi:Tfp pilus assembly protein PilF
MYNIIPLILILASLVVILIVVARKFSVLANLNVNNIPSEKEVRFKEQIIGKRLKRNFSKYTSRTFRLLNSLREKISAVSEGLYGKLVKIRDQEKIKRDLVLSESSNGMDMEAKSAKLFNEIEKAVKNADYSEAEKKLIEVISIDSKNIKAFKLLGEVYLEKKEANESRQTFEHVLKLLDDEEESYNLSAVEDAGAAAKIPGKRISEIYNERSQTYYDLAIVNQLTGKMEQAAHNLKSALVIEPNNPRYLDSMIEISIINKDKIGALDAFGRLAEVNPENQKLAEFKKQIDSL